MEVGSQHPTSLHSHSVPVFCEFAATHKSQAIHFILLIVSWEPANLAGIIRKSWEMEIGQKTPRQLPSLPLESFAREAQVLFTFLPVGFLLPVGRLIKPGSPAVRCGWMVKSPGSCCCSSLSEAFGGLSLPVAAEEEGNWLPTASVGSRWQKGKAGTEEMGGRAGGPGPDGIPISSGWMFPLL